MPQISRFSKSAFLATALGLGSVLCLPASAANPPGKPAAPHAVDPQVKQFTAAAMQAIRKGNLSLATIQLKNALRLDPTNGALRVQLGIVELEGGDPISAEREIRQGRLHGAKDEEAVPPLMQAMLARQEYSDLLFQFPDPPSADKSKLAQATLRARAEALQATHESDAAVAAMDRALAMHRDAAGLLERGRIAVLQNKPDQALGFIDQALKLSPNDPPGVLMKAGIVRLHDKKAALALVDGLLKAHPDSITAVVARIEMLLDLKRNEDAQKAVDALIARSPKLPIAIFYKAVLLDQHKKAHDAWRIAQSLPGEFIQSNGRIAIGVTQIAIDSGNTESANSILTTYVGQHPSFDEGRARLAALRDKMGNPAYALEILQPLLNSQNPRILELIAATYGQLKQTDKAADYMRKAEAAGSKDPNLGYRIAIADLAQNNTADGIKTLVALLKKQPGNLNPAITGVEILGRQKKFADAQTLIDQAEKINPKSPIPPFLSGQILFQQGKQDASLPLFGKALQRDPHYAPAMFARAQVNLMQHKFDDAARDLKLAQAVQPKNPLSYVKLAEVAALKKQPAQAVALLNQGIALNPKAIPPRLVLAKYQISQRQFGEAQATLKAALKISPNDPQSLALLGQVQQATGQKTAAVGTNKALTKKYQKSGAAQALLANSLLASGDKKGAIAALKRATELSPTVQQYYDVLIALQIQMGDKDGAVATARKWASGEKGPDGAILLAQTLSTVGRLPEAASVISTAQTIRPDWQLTIVQAQIARARGQQAQALSMLKEWLSDHSTDAPVRQAYADMLLAANDNAAALKQYEIFLKARGDNPNVLNNVAWLLRDASPARALTLATKAAQLAPTSPDIADTLGYLLLRKKDAKGALPMLQRAHTLGPKNGQIAYHLAQAYYSLGRKADAKRTLQDALAKGGDFADAAEAKKLLQQL